jgi:hypothetical protein
MTLPFGGEDGDAVNDMKARLATPRPLSLLKKYRVAYACPADCVVEDSVDCALGGDGTVWVFCGGDSWELMVKRGLLSGDDAKPPVDSVWLWLPELFKLLDAVADNEPLARRLAAAWYYTATEVDFSNDSDDEEEDQDDAAVMAPKSASTTSSPVAAPAVSDDNDDDDDNVDDGQDEDDNDAADDDDDDDDDGEDYTPEGDDEDEEIVDDADENDAVDAFTDMADAMAQGGRENAIEALGRMMSAAAANGETLTAGAFEPPEARDARVSILKAIRRMHAYLPSPDTHMPYFKRMLKKINTGGCDEWFPWGAPPLQHMVDLLTKDMSDNEPNNFMRESLTVFAQAQQ